MFSLKLFDFSTNEPFFPNFTKKKKKDINHDLPSNLTKKAQQKRSFCL